MQGKTSLPVQRGVLWVSMGIVLALSGFASADTAAGPRFRDFSGAMYDGDGSEPLWQHAMGWNRREFLWANYEPTKGNYNQALLQSFAQKLEGYAAQGITVLPLLDYNTTWSGETSDVHSPLAASHVADWENYVRRVVTYLRQAPYNVEYFQIWNEAHPASGFWNGSLDDYMVRVHLPAAAIIRELGGKVVYGGFPMCGSVQDYIALLDAHSAWGSIDVLDVHYFGVDAWQALYDAAVSRGYPDIGIWQTEIGFTGDPSYAASTYPQFLSWALAHDWSWPDRYKLFYYTFWAPDVPGAYGYNLCLYSGNHITPVGQGLLATGQLLDGQGLRNYAPFTLDGAAGSDCFAVDDRLVLAVRGPSGNITAGFPGVQWAQVKSAAKYDHQGNATDVLAGLQVNPAGGVRVNLSGATAESASFIVLTLHQGSEVFSRRPVADTVVGGRQVVLEAELAHPWGAVTYQWTRNGSPIAAAPSAPTLTFEAIAPADRGWYSCTVTDGTGATYTTPAVFLEVLDPAELPAGAPAAVAALAAMLALAGAALLRRRAASLRRR